MDIIRFHPATKLADINRLARELGGRVVCVNGSVRIRRMQELTGEAMKRIEREDFEGALGNIRSAMALIEGVAC
jgi:hypothetical protein